jgi:hypothetical protein
MKFVNLIEPYFIPQFKYKLKLRGSYKTKTTNKQQIVLSKPCFRRSVCKSKYSVNSLYGI